jgi:hypothetical protein
MNGNEFGECWLTVLRNSVWIEICEVLFYGTRQENGIVYVNVSIVHGIKLHQKNGKRMRNNDEQIIKNDAELPLENDGHVKGKHVVRPNLVHHEDLVHRVLLVLMFLGI